VNTARHQNDSVFAKFSEAEIPLRRVEGLSHLVFDSLYPIDALGCMLQMQWFAETTRRTLHSPVLQSGLIIRERVNKVVFIVDEHTIHKIDISSESKTKAEKVTAGHI
jgi:hypothetical protein